MLMPVRIALLFALTLCEGIAASDKPNILLIYTDDNGPETTWKERIKKFV